MECINDSHQITFCWNGLLSEWAREDVETSRGLAEKRKREMKPLKINAKSTDGGSFISCLFSERDLSNFIG